jgi:hypothetical protein
VEELVRAAVRADAASMGTVGSDAAGSPTTGPPADPSPVLSGDGAIRHAATDLSELAGTRGASGPPAAGSRLRPPGILDLEELLGDHLNTRVTVDMGSKHGRVVIEFANLDDLERIYRVIIGGNTPHE